MKKIFLSAIVAAAAALPTFAAVDTLNYSAVVRDANGNAVANQEVTLMFQFLEDNDVKFEETAKVTTSAAGVVNYAIGSTQSLDGVDWNANNVKLVVSMDQNGGSDLKLVSDSNVASVPTALYALKSADSEMIYNDIDQLYGLNERNQAQLNNVAADFANLGENLDNFANEMDARFTEVNGQLENLNMVSAVVRENEEQIEKNTNEIAAVKKDAYDAFEDIYMQLGTLEQVVSAVEALDGWHRDNDETFIQMLNDVKKNATDIEGLMEDVDNIYGQNERTQSQLSNVAADIAGVKEDVDNIYGLNDRTTAQLNDVFAKIAGVEEDIDNIYGQNERTTTQLNNVAAKIAGVEEDIEALQGKDERFETQFNTLVNDLGGVKEDIDALYGKAERTETQLNNVAADFANLGENLDNLVNEMTEANLEQDRVIENLKNYAEVTNATFEEINGQLENLNMVAAVVRANEEQIEKNTTDIAEIKKDTYGAVEDILKELGEVSSEVESLAAWHRENDETLLGLPGTLTAMNESIAEVDTRVEELEQKDSTLQVTLQTLDNLANENNQAIETLTNTLTDLLEEYGITKGKVEQLEGQVNALLEELGK